MFDANFYKNRNVLLTGHTGFKGSWLSRILINCGANLVGYSLEPPTAPDLFDLSNVKEHMVSVIADIRDYEKLLSVFEKYRPEVVIHMAAQPLVRDSYREPRYTYDVNVMGTVNVLECVRRTPSVKSFLNVTTDKVYFNDEQPDHPFKENEPLDGYDPYSNSKSCSELVTHSYSKSFFEDKRCAVSTARAGNVIGGGDFAADRIIPDCVRAVEAGRDIVVRNPYSTRPYQHVLEPLFVYLEIAQKQFEDSSIAGCYNVGPDDCDCVDTGELATRFCKAWGDGVKWINKHDGGPHEAAFLKLDNSKLKRVFDWRPRWHIDESIDKIVEWTRCYFADKNGIPQIMDKQIKEFMDK